MKIVVGIPARMGSSRFPGKPLAKILGLPMVGHVYRRCLLAKNVDETFIATCDQEIMDAAEAMGAQAFMTPKDIERPGLRVAEACKQLPLSDDDIVVVVQGDEPLVHPGMIDLAVQPMLVDPSIQLVTLVADANETEWRDPNEVKVVVDLKQDVLFMTRSPAPSNEWGRIGPRLKQVAIMPFRRKMMLAFPQMAPTPYEIAEQVELLRAVEHGVKIRAVKSPYRSVSVDTEQDRQEVEAAMAHDEFYPQYAKGR